MSHSRFEIKLSIRRAVLTHPLAFILALLGFSYALATPASPRAVEKSRQAHAQSRAINQPLSLTDPFILAGSDPAFPTGGNLTTDPDGFDLGDVCGNLNFTRYISAAGGFMPYVFQIKPLLGALTPGAGTQLPPLPSLTLSGILTGSLTAPADTGTVLHFSIFLTDITSAQRAGIYRLNLLNCADPSLKFHIAQNQVPEGQQSNNYFTRLGTLGGVSPIVFSVQANSVSVGGVQLSSLEDAGLTLGSDGTLFGRPIKAGNINFTVLATDKNGAQAFSRGGGQVGQAYVLPVTTGLPLTTELIATHCAISGKTAKPGIDSIEYNGFLDARGETAATLAGTQFTVRIGVANPSNTTNASNPYEAVFSGAFDDKGKVKSGKKTVVTFTPISGALKINLSSKDIISNLTSSLAPSTKFTNKTGQTVVLAIEVGEPPPQSGILKPALRTCEVLRMDTHLGGGGFSLFYGIGTRGYSRAGGFQVLSLTGEDVTIGKTDKGDSWKVRFFGMPGQDEDNIAGPATNAKGKPVGPTPSQVAPTAPATVKAVSSLNIGIGNFTQNIAVTLVSVRLKFRATGKDAGIFRFTLDPQKFVHEMETNPISETDTGISAAINTKNLTPFPLEMDFTGFKGVTGRIMAPNHGTWTQQ